MKFLRKRTRHDEASIRETLEQAGASSSEAEQIVSTLANRLSPDEMNVWLAHPEKSHPIPDDSTIETFGTTLNWTAINAISAGKTELVVAEARRFAGGGDDLG